jgi:hypothetical protein
MRRATFIGAIRESRRAMTALAICNDLPAKVFLTEVVWWVRHWLACRRQGLPLVPAEWEDAVYYTV